MKKMTILLVLLLAGMLAVAGFLPWGMPKEENLVPGPAEQEDGAMLVAENRWFTSRIYTLREGLVSGVYEESRIRDGAESRIVRVTALDSGACFIRVFGDGADWELVKLEGGNTQLLYRDTFEDKVSVTGLRLQGDSYWITAVGDNKAIFVYEYTAAEGLALRMLLPAWWLWDTVAAEYDGEIIRATTAYGDSYFMTPGGDLTYSPEAAETPLPSFAAEGTGWLLCKRTVMLSVLLLWGLVAVLLLVTQAISRRADRLANRLTAVGGAAVLLVLLAAAGMVFGVVRVTGGLLISWQAGRLALLAALLLWGLVLVLLRITSGRITRPVGALTQQMNRVSEGDATAQEASPGRDELCRMDQSLQMMCMNLSVWKYETACTIQSYRRFVPEKMAQLLERPVAEEIQLGDSHRLVGNVGVFSVGNRAQARNTLEDDAFVDFINHSFGMFYDSITENHGWMISSGLRLSDMAALFPLSPADGVRAGLDFLGKIQVKTAEAIPEPRACLILHKASFLYGIAGQEERLFPYLSSAELEFLVGYAQKFDEAGVQIVATEEYWEQLKDCGFTGRYIGFVSVGERSGAYKLYEVLDAYPELERELRRGYDQRFQEAINLFYHNDFYLARNLFSTLLRACPGDGIARWYLFTCERFFNQEGGEEPDYSLFGAEG